MISRIKFTMDTDDEWMQVQKYLKNIGFLWASEYLNPPLTPTIKPPNTYYSIVIRLTDEPIPVMKLSPKSKNGINFREFSELYYPFISNTQEDRKEEFVETVKTYMLNSKRTGYE